MSYTKSFQSVIVIYPDFNKNSYCEYFKEKLNDWVTECFNTYTDFFNIKVSQAKGNAVLYTFSAEDGDYDLNFKKLWQKSPASVTIEISGSGIVNHGLKNNLEPPYDISEEILDTIYLKYQETSDLYEPKIIVYGKDPVTRRTEVPIQHTFDSYDTEKWQDGTLPYDVYSEKWKLSVHTDYQGLIDVYNVFERLEALNKNSLLKIYVDHMENFIELSGQFILKKEDKEQYLSILKELSIYLIEDDMFKIEDCDMNFISESEKEFYFEKYYIDDIQGKFRVRNILI